MKSDWKTVFVGDLGRIITGKTPKTAIKENYGGIIPFLTPSDDMNIKHVISTSKTLSDIGLAEVKSCLLPPRSVCVSCIGSDLGKVVMTTQPTVTNQQINSIIPTEGVDPDFLYYSMIILGKELNYISKTSTAVPIINKSTFSKHTIILPPIDEQRAIASVLSIIDERIANNLKINNHLEQVARAFFKSWFIDFEPFDGEMPIDWQVGNLTDIASYLNGLTMQRFRPMEGENGLPVLKIKELRQGICDSSSDLCSPSINPDYIVRDGDVIFSWSGSLLVDFWCGGDCGLNQHLFKVASQKYDKWFYYSWTHHHLERFIALAADKATTMGHIKRSDLENAKVLIPSERDYQEVGKLLTPVYEHLICNRIENRKLALLRDTLLPLLMSGELSVTELSKTK